MSSGARGNGRLPTRKAQAGRSLSSCAKGMGKATSGAAGSTSTSRISSAIERGALARAGASYQTPTAQVAGLYQRLSVGRRSTA